MSENQNNSDTGMGFFGFLGLLFIGLKLMHFIDWPWVWVLAPLWGPFVVLIIFFAIALFFTTRR